MGREGERKGEKRQCVVVSHVAPTGDLARSPHQLGLKVSFIAVKYISQ